MEGKGHDPRVWPYGRDVNATKKSRLGRYEHRFLIRGPIQVSDGPVDSETVDATKGQRGQGMSPRLAPPQDLSPYWSCTLGPI